MSRLKKPSQETDALGKVLNNSHHIFLFWHLVCIKEKSSEDFIKRSMQCVECNPQIRHITKEGNHLTLKTLCKNKELIYCISGRNASEKELDLQINWYQEPITHRLLLILNKHEVLTGASLPLFHEGVWDSPRWSEKLRLNSIKIDSCPFGSHFALCIFLHWYLQLLA